MFLSAFLLTFLATKLCCLPTGEFLGRKLEKVSSCSQQLSFVQRGSQLLRLLNQCFAAQLVPTCPGGQQNGKMLRSHSSEDTDSVCCISYDKNYAMNIYVCYNTFDMQYITSITGPLKTNLA